jgi:hypothetical protein
LQLIDTSRRQRRQRWAKCPADALTDPGEQMLAFTNTKTKQLQTLEKNAFRFRENNIVLVK